MTQDSNTPAVIRVLSDELTTSFPNVISTYPTSLQSRDVEFHQLSPDVLLRILSETLTNALTEARDNAKYMYEEEGDEELLGEYQGLVAALEIVGKTVYDVRRKRYTAPNMDDYAYKYGGYPPNHPLYGYTV